MFDNLNEQQKDAIVGSFANDSMIIAGAGSGKSRVIVERVKYILENKDVEPCSIMCITFTNKAAKELLNRVNKVCKDAEEMWVGTFHGICIRLLKMFGADIGLYDFTILDSYNSKKSAIDVLNSMGAVISKELLNNYLSRISHLKNDLVTSKKYRNKILSKYASPYEAQNDIEYQFAEFYTNYQKENMINHTIDFDDIILYTIILLKKSKDAQDFVKNQFKFINVDETQDSNNSNIMLFKLLSLHCNLFIVGDPDQSIYGWRGAKPNYLIKEQYVYNLFKLEQNYRSTKTIVGASNCVIANNKNRIDKTCFTNNKDGCKITVKSFDNNKLEAIYVACMIKKIHDKLNIGYNNIFILYRTNAQSRIFEETFLHYSIPYVLIGATGFNERKEIKDCLAFVRLSVNHKDKQSFKRALSCLDGIGKKTVEDILYIYKSKKDFVQTLKVYKAPRKKAADSISFLIDILNMVNTNPYSIIDKIGNYFIKKLKVENTEKSNERIENIEELKKMAREKQKSNVLISDFILQLDLLSSKDKKNEPNCVSMMTIHASKGLESNIVFGVGMNEGLLPHKNSFSNDDAMEEERRLMYVLMTRAKYKLFLTHFCSDRQRDFRMSRFLYEIPDIYIKK